MKKRKKFYVKKTEEKRRKNNRRSILRTDYEKIKWKNYSKKIPTHTKLWKKLVKGKKTILA